MILYLWNIRNFTDGENYSISGINSGETFESGELVSFSVTSDSVFNTIESVSYNGEVITSNGDNYSFAMSDEDVTIEVRTSEVGKYDEPSDNLSWDKNVLSEISVAEDSSSWNAVQDLVLDFGDSSGNYLGNIKATIETSNENVIPKSVLTYETNTNEGSGRQTGGVLKVDLKQIKKGDCLVYINLDSVNGSLGTLIKKFTVVDYGKVSVDTATANLKFSFDSDVDKDKVFMNISDTEYIYENDADLSDWMTIYLSDLKNDEYVFDKYIFGHSYRVSFGYFDDEGNYDSSINIVAREYTSGGSSITGYLNQYIYGIMTVRDSGGTVEFDLSK